MRLFNKIAIVGVGLIGGSLGLAIKKNGLAKEVLGIFRRKSSLKSAILKRAIDKASLDIKNIKDADLVVLSGPVSVIIKQLPIVFNLAKENAIIMDTGSTKAVINHTAEKLLKIRTDVTFIGAHPLAGLEKTGVESARSDLFSKSICIICPVGKHADEKIISLWRKIGSKIEMMSAVEHDKTVSFVSHLPHLLAFALVNTLPDKYRKFVSTGFKDSSRIAASDPLLWRDIFLTNKRSLLISLKAYKKNLSSLEKALLLDKESVLERAISKSSAKRNALR